MTTFPVNPRTDLPWADSIIARLDRTCRRHTGFSDFADLLNALGSYRPTVHVAKPSMMALANYYDMSMEILGSERRAYRYGQERIAYRTYYVYQDQHRSLVCRQRRPEGEVVATVRASHRNEAQVQFSKSTNYARFAY